MKQLEEEERMIAGCPTVDLNIGHIAAIPARKVRRHSASNTATAKGYAEV